MDQITRLARTDRRTDTQRRAAAVERVAEYYGERYGAEFADFARRSANDDFDY